MQWKEMYPKEHLTVDDLGKRQVTVEIEAVYKTTVKIRGKSSDEWRMKFKGAKKYLRLNASLAEEIAAATGTAESQEAVGKRVTLFAGPRTAYGETRMCVCVKPAPKVEPKEEPQTNEQPEPTNQSEQPESEVTE
jgi:hypothetical protein